MKNYLLLALLLLFGTMAFGQTTFGVGVSYDENLDFGVHARAKLGLQEKLAVQPQFTYWFQDGFTVLSLDANLAYDVAMIGEMPIYALGGLDWTRISFGGASDANFGINIGAGVTVGGNIYIEPRWQKFLCEDCGSGIGVNAGYYF